MSIDDRDIEETTRMLRGDDAVTPPPTTPRGRVLVAEDNPEMRDLVVEVLRADGWDVEPVSSGEDLLRVVRERSVATWPTTAFDVIVTDHRMPHGNGLDVVQELRRAGCTTPVLVVTGFASDGMGTKADALEAMLMEKPVSLQTLRTAVEVLHSVSALGASRTTPWP